MAIVNRDKNCTKLESVYKEAHRRHIKVKKSSRLKETGKFFKLYLHCALYDARGLIQK